MHIQLVESVSHCLHKVHWHMGDDPPIITYNTSLEAWPTLLELQPDRFVDRVESCIAEVSESEEHGGPTCKHYHSFVRIFLAPFEGETETVIFVERKIGEAGHTVIPTVNTLPNSNAQAVEDHACMVFDGAHSKFAHKPKVDRSIIFPACKDRRLSLQELSGVYQFISRRGPYSPGEDCTAHSLWFARTCIAALKAVLFNAHYCVTPAIREEDRNIDRICQNAIELFINHTLKTEYPIKQIADKHRLRQLDALCGEEKVERKLAIERSWNRENEKAMLAKIFKEKFG